MHPCGGVFKLFCPRTAYGVLLAGLNVLLYRPLKLFKFTGGKQLLCLGVRYAAVVVGKPLIPGTHLCINLGYGGIKLLLQIFYIFV